MRDNACDQQNGYTADDNRWQSADTQLYQRLSAMVELAYDYGYTCKNPQHGKKHECPCLRTRHELADDVSKGGG